MSSSTAGASDDGGVGEPVCREEGAQLLIELVHGRVRALVGVVDDLAEGIHAVGMRVPPHREQRLVSLLRSHSEERAIERAGDRRRRIDGQQPAAVDQRNAIAAVGFIHVRRRDDDRQPAAFQIAEQIPEFASQTASTPVVGSRETGGRSWTSAQQTRV